MSDEPQYFDWVYNVAKKIPPGRVTSYGAIADYLALGSARMVGWAMRQLRPGNDVPAHRVVNHKGELTGRHHFVPPSRMQELLEKEGTPVANHRVTSFKEKLWLPAEHLADEDVDI